MRFVPLLLFALLACALAAGAMWRQTSATSAMTSPLLGRPFPALELEALEAESAFTLPVGRPVLINLFASWCEPCALEQPALLDLQKRGMTVLGVAWRDKPENIRAWLARHGNPYAAVGLDPKGIAATSLSASGVPENLVVDRHGIVRFTYPGMLTQEMIAQDILPLLQETR